MKGRESIAGIMGGEHSGCDEKTVDVLIESALWDPLNVAKSGREHGIITDARYRFERGVDPEYMVAGLERATELVLELCGGIAAEANVVGYEGYTAKAIDFPVSEVKRLTGIDVPAAEIAQYSRQAGLRRRRLWRCAEGFGSVLAAGYRRQGRPR